ncbi:MAG: hypothetical protein RAO92_04625 [Candidatus Euphemobacter frigidus]|nr:hypothetical protein [Candidatus Euphemobacter frigidus]MDP8275672.1 hypothetical protein [Candidatus Euphemobacter frigidus]
MTDIDTKTLEEELDQFRQEKEKIRQLVGKIGGKQLAKRDKIINATFIVMIAIIFLLDILRHATGAPIPLPPLLLVDLGVLMISMKIIWMIHKQSKVEHFQFWILSAMEWRLNEIFTELKELHKKH